MSNYSLTLNFCGFNHSSELYLQEKREAAFAFIDIYENPPLSNYTDDTDHAIRHDRSKSFDRNLIKTFQVSRC